MTHIHVLCYHTTKMKGLLRFPLPSSCSFMIFLLLSSKVPSSAKSMDSHPCYQSALSRVAKPENKMRHPAEKVASE